MVCYSGHSLYNEHIVCHSGQKRKGEELELAKFCVTSFMNGPSPESTLGDEAARQAFGD